MEGVFKTQDFNFDLPNELIANKPCFPRDESKMLIYQDYQIKQSQSKNLAQFLSKGDILVLNEAIVGSIGFEVLLHNCFEIKLDN